MIDYTHDLNASNRKDAIHPFKYKALNNFIFSLTATADSVYIYIIDDTVQ